ncbi:MAG: HNH endonuclease [Anaerolineae bacterium]
MTYIPDALRQEVIKRAKGRCEYCLLHQDDNLFPHEIDHIIAEKHHGETISDNLCLSCLDCNRHKGSDLTSIDLETGDVVVLFHPRRDRWEDHFKLESATIVPLTNKGRVTVFLLDMNAEEQIAKRAGLIELGRYPTP